MVSYEPVNQQKACFSTTDSTAQATPNSASQSTFDISHELRTPLTVIQGALNLLSSGKLGTLSQQEMRMVTIAANSADRLLRLTTAIEGEPNNRTDFLSTEALAQLRLEHELHSALAHQEFLVYYQPIVSLVTRQTVGFEALLRWQHPVLGMIPPDQFIPLLEANGLIVSIGAWVLQETCRQLRNWQQQFPDRCATLTVSVNLSSKQLAQPDLVEQVKQTLQETGLSANCLSLEITESAVMENATSAKEVLEKLQALDIQIYIDDFGTGYSSLSRLYELPLDVLKIDRTFVQRLNLESGEHLVRAISNLARSLGIDLIAEGVETVEQLSKLQTLGCTRGQGYLFAEPLAGNAVIDWIYDSFYTMEFS